jgi:hypothetical protein
VSVVSGAVDVILELVVCGHERAQPVYGQKFGR